MNNVINQSSCKYWKCSFFAAGNYWQTRMQILVNKLKIHWNLDYMKINLFKYMISLCFFSKLWEIEKIKNKLLKLVVFVGLSLYGLCVSLKYVPHINITLFVFFSFLSFLIAKSICGIREQLHNFYFWGITLI